MTKTLLLVTDKQNPLFDVLEKLAAKHGISAEQLALRYIAMAAGAESEELPEVGSEAFAQLLNDLASS